MLKIKDGPLCGAVKSGIILCKGYVAQFVVENNKVVFDKSDGSSPVGMVVGLSGNSTDVMVEFRSFSGETDIFDTEAMYPVNANLYVSKQGILTTNRYKSNIPCVGMVVGGPPTANDGNLKFLWF